MKVFLNNTITILHLNIRNGDPAFQFLEIKESESKYIL